MRHGIFLLVIKVVAAPFPLSVSIGRYLNEIAGESFAFQLATNFYSNQNPEMATVVSLSSISPNLNLNSKNFTSQPTYSRKLSRVRCNVENSSTKGEPEPRNALLKIAWYGSELLGIAASFLRSPSPSDVENDLKLATDGSGAAELDRATVVEAIKEDFARSYFVTGLFANALINLRILLNSFF